MSKSTEPPIDQATYWREDGGSRWVENIDNVETMIAPLSMHVAANAHCQPGEKILDVGCGGGTTSALLAEQVGPEGRVVGLDISPTILEVAKRRFAGVSNLSFVEADAGTHDFGGQHFDVLVSRFGVMFFEQPIQAFTHLHKALANTGRISFICWQPLTENHWMFKPAQAAFGILPAPPPPEPNAPGPFAFADPDYVRRILSLSGFREIRIEPLHQPLALGDIDTAIKFLCEMGPAATPLKEACEKDRALVIDAWRTLLAEHQTKGVVQFQSATWLVSARKSG